MLKKTMLAAACLALAACGGDDAPDPASRTFDYGTPVLVSMYSPESDAAQTGASALQDAATYRATPDDATSAETASGSLATLPDQMADQMSYDGPTLQAPQATAKRVGAAITGAAFQGQAFGGGFDDPECVDVSPGRVTYTGCSMTDPYDGSTIEVDGSFSRSGDVFAWDATMVVSMSETDMDGSTFGMRVQNRLSGAITVAASTIDGRARSDMSGTVSFDAQTFHFGVTTIADLDLDYVADPFCVTGGTLELRRVWTRRPTGATSADLPDQGAMFTWLGCGEVMVARSR